MTSKSTSKRPFPRRRTAVVVAIALCSTIALNAQATDRHHGSRATAHFAKMDANSDGMLTQAEVDTYRANRAAEMDSNGDGVVSFEEAYAKRQAKQEQRAQARFARQDENGDGVLSTEEIGNRAAAMFERLDANADGVVSEDELPTGRGKHRRGRQQQGQGE